MYWQKKACTLKVKSEKELLFVVRITYLTAVLRVYSHQTSALMPALLLTLMLGRNTLISAVTFTPHISMSINTTRMHSIRMRTASSLTVSRRILCMPPPSNHACPPPGNHARPLVQPHMHPWQPHMPPQQPCMPPTPGNHTCPPQQPCMPPGNHPAATHVPPVTMHAPLATMHSPSNHTGPLANMHAPQQPRMPPGKHTCPPSNHACLLPPLWTDRHL